MTLKLPLEIRGKRSEKEFPWASCAPFVENSRGVLIHRPRSGTTYNLHKEPHIGIKFWCGMSVSSGKGNLTLLDVPPDGRIVCERCEALAVANGLPSADALAGKHVHKGRTVAVKMCCADTPNVALSERPLAADPLEGTVMRGGE